VKPIHPNDKPKVIALGVISFGMFAYFAMTLAGAMKQTGNPATAKVVMVQANPVNPPTDPSGGVSRSPVNVPPPAPGFLAQNITGFGGPADPFRKVLPDPSTLSMPATSSGPKADLGFVKRIGGKLSGSVSPMIPGTLGTTVSPSPSLVFEPSIRLKGILGDKDYVAMISCAGKTDMYRAGTRIAGTYEILKISSTLVMFRGPHGTFRLEIGEEHRPEDPAPALGGPKLIGQTSDRVMADYSGLPLPGRN
jgi:hypothetical protein